MFLGGISILAGISYARFGKGGRFPGQAPNFASIKTLFFKSSFWIMVILFSLAIGSTLGVYTMLPLYLINEYGMSQNWANTLLALSRISSLGMAFLAGWTTDRLGIRRTITTVFLLTGISTILLGIAPSSWIVIIVFVQPAVAVCFFPPGFAALSSIGPPNTRNVAVSLTIPAAFILGGGVVPTSIGLLADAGRFAFGFFVVGIITLSAVLLSLFLKLSGEANQPP